MVVILSCAITGAEAATVVVQVKDRNNAPVANAVVWAMPVGAMPPPAPPSTTRTLVIEQRMMKFEPYVSIVQTGTLLRLPNRDRIEHHVKTLSGPNVFEYRLYLREPPEPVRLSKAGHTVLQCLVHDWMAAHIYTVDTPWFAKTNRDGSAIIESVPAGEYEIYLAHPNLALPTQVTPLFPRRVRLEATTAQLLDAKLDIVPRPEPSRRPVPEQYRD
ncbi:MAG: methylamine utilization protein [Casimicrobiaceae bacterium]|nr:methylamine utilization protein [Casimicrobiaceae bacterium]MDW8311822.1 methylamine utilization protein [Burkholderiales bacterium]